MRSWLSHVDWRGAAMEPLEQRRLMAAGWMVQTELGMGQEAGLVQSMRQREKLTFVSTGDLIATYTGRLVITRARGVNLAPITGVPTTVKTAVLQITAQARDGQVLGFFAVDDLGFTGTYGPVGVSGTIIGKRVNLVLTDGFGIGVGSIQGKISNDRRQITAKFISSVDFGTVVGQLTVTNPILALRRKVDRD